MQSACYLLPSRQGRRKQLQCKCLCQSPVRSKVQKGSQTPELISLAVANSSSTNSPAAQSLQSPLPRDSSCPYTPESLLRFSVTVHD